MTVPLRYVADVRTSSVDKHVNAHELPVQLCNYTDVYKNDRVRPGDEMMRATASAEEVARFRLEVGDSVLTKDSEDPADIGISAYVDATSPDFVCGYHLAIARPLAGTEPRYLTWALRARPVLDHFTNHASGISRHGLTTAGLRSAPIPLIDQGEQRRIADFLDDRVARIDQTIAGRRAQISALKELENSTLSGLVEALGALHGWAPLRRFSGGIEQGGSPTAEDRVAAPGEVGVLKTNAIQRGRFVASNHKAVSPEGLDTAHQVLEGDLLVTRGSGSADLVGDAAVARLAGTPLYLSDLTYRVRRLSIDSEFACLALISSRGRAELGARVRQGSGPAKARGEDVLALPIPLAPASNQSELVSTCQAERSRVQAARESLDASIGLISEYKQSLITAAVIGELDVTTAGSGIPG